MRRPSLERRGGGCTSYIGGARGKIRRCVAGGRVGGVQGGQLSWLSITPVGAACPGRQRQAACWGGALGSGLCQQLAGRRASRHDEGSEESPPGCQRCGCNKVGSTPLSGCLDSTGTAPGCTNRRFAAGGSAQSQPGKARRSCKPAQGTHLRLARSSLHRGRPARRIAHCSAA